MEFQASPAHPLSKDSTPAQFVQWTRMAAQARMKDMGLSGDSSRKKRAPSDVAKGQKGQVSILIGTMMLTFVLFFSFVINTGMLVNAKINLQNAADLAAYAGASVQARQLTDISYLNYEMRRQFKKFLFRYYVVGNMAQQTHPTSASGIRVWKPKPASSVTHGVPAVCVVFNSGDNYCQIESLPPIPTPSVAAGPPDAIMTALADQLQQIEALRKRGCIGIGQSNKMLLYFWLMNTDLDLDAITNEIRNSAGGGADAQAYAARLSALRTLAAGIGLVPKEMMLRKRIDTLNRYVNFPPQTGLTLSGVQAFQANTRDWAARERPIQAFLSAYFTLGTHTFRDSDITLDEIIPGGPDGANLLKLNNVYAEFDAYAVDMAIPENNQPACTPGQSQTQGAANDRDNPCTHCLTPMSLKGNNRLVAGVAKDPSVLTYYAVRLTAKARLLFNPFSEDLVLKAYSAAQPFGSRIGPPETEAQFTASAKPSSPNRCFGAVCVDRIPNLPVLANDPDTPTMNDGWNRNEVIFNYFRGFAPQLGGGGGGPVPQTLNHPEMLRAYHVAMSPTPWESGKYNIPNDLVADPFVEHFDGKSVHAIWAPLFTEGASQAASNPAAEIIQMIDAFVPDDPNAQQVFTPQAKAALVNGITTYVNSFLVNGNGEDGEGLNVYRFFNPFKYRPEGNTASSPLNLPSSIYMSDPALVKTSWNQVLNGQYRALGRTGYSVKFVPLKLLQNPSGITTNGTSSFANRLPGSNGVTEDIEGMQH